MNPTEKNLEAQITEDDQPKTLLTVRNMAIGGTMFVLAAGAGVYAYVNWDKTSTPEVPTSAGAKQDAAPIIPANDINRTVDPADKDNPSVNNKDPANGNADNLGGNTADPAGNNANPDNINPGGNTSPTPAVEPAGGYEVKLEELRVIKPDEPAPVEDESKNYASETNNLREQASAILEELIAETTSRALAAAPVVDTTTTVTPDVNAKVEEDSGAPTVPVADTTSTDTAPVIPQTAPVLAPADQTANPVTPIPTSTSGVPEGKFVIKFVRQYTDEFKKKVKSALKNTEFERINEGKIVNLIFDNEILWAKAYINLMKALRGDFVLAKGEQTFFKSFDGKGKFSLPCIRGTKPLGKTEQQYFKLGEFQLDNEYSIVYDKIETKTHTID